MDMMDPNAQMMADPNMMGGDPSMMGMEDPSLAMGDPMAQVEPGQMGPPGAMGMEQDNTNEIAMMSIESVVLNHNLAKKLKNKKDKDGNNILEKMSHEILEGIKLDEQSREDWIAQAEEGYKLALLVAENKSWPWPEASNVKYPLIATAAMQFSARAYPALVPADGAAVKARAVPSAINGMFLDSATRVGRHMSWQLMVKDYCWEQEMDKLLMTLSVVGTMFKKTYYDSQEDKNCSYIIYPKDFIVDYHATSLEKAYRKTEIIRLNDNKLREKVNNDEEFLDLEYGEPRIWEADQDKIESDDVAPSVNKATPHIFYQCHTFWDLDEDGYEEPVIITIHEPTEQVVRVTARYTSNSVDSDQDGNIIRIRPLEYYTAFTFIENPAGSLYGIGFGLLLGPINDAINTIINQLVDAGTLNNLQSGYISKTLRLNMSQQGFTPGEWKVCQASGEEMKNGIMPLPTKEPSPVLMQLVQMLIQSGMQLASVAEIFVGKMPGQNTPATTTQATVEQSMAVFTAVYKRVYRALNEEYKKLMYLNKINPDLVQREAAESGLDISPEDYMLPEYSIVPGADPAGDSQTVKQQKFAFVAQMLVPMGFINPQALTQWALEFMEVPNYQNLMVQQPPPPPPDPAMMKAESDIKVAQVKMQMDQQDRIEEREHKKQMAGIEFALAKQKMQTEAQKAALDRMNQQEKNRMDSVDRVNKLRASAQESQMKSVHARAEMQAKFAENRQSHQQKMEQTREAAAEKQKQQKASAKVASPKK